MSPKRKPTKKARANTILKPFHLQRGLSAGSDYRIRLARPGEADIVRTLLADTGTAMDDDHLASIDSGIISAGLLPSLTAKEPFEPLSQTLASDASAGELVTGVLKLSAVLVATTHNDEVVAALDAHPPASLLPKAIDAGINKHHALLSVLVIIKIAGVAVAPDHRGNYLGTKLLKRCTQLYFQLGYQLAYGQFDTARNLGSFYTDRGFTLLDSRESISLEERLTLPITIGADTGEQMFYKWNRN